MNRPTKNVARPCNPAFIKISAVGLCARKPKAIDIKNTITVARVLTSSSFILVRISRSEKQHVNTPADIVRKRKVLEIIWKKTGDMRLEIEVTTEAGLYIKELVSGDEGRTEPSVSGLLKTDASVKELTVVGVGE